MSTALYFIIWCMIFSIGIQNSWRSWNNTGRNGDVSNQNDSSEKLQIVIITLKRVVSLLNTEFDTTLSLVF